MNVQAKPATVTTGPIVGSRKVYSSPEGRPDIAVPFKEIDLHPTANEPALRLYDTSGPYTDADARIDLAGGRPLRDIHGASWKPRIDKGFGLALPQTGGWPLVALKLPIEMPRRLAQQRLPSTCASRATSPAATPPKPARWRPLLARGGSRCGRAMSSSWTLA